MIVEEREYVPYDLSSEEDRKALRNKWVSAEGDCSRAASRSMFSLSFILLAFFP